MWEGPGWCGSTRKATCQNGFGPKLANECQNRVVRLGPAWATSSCWVVFYTTLIDAWFFLKRRRDDAKSLFARQAGRNDLLLALVVCPLTMHPSQDGAPFSLAVFTEKLPTSREGKFGFDFLLHFLCMHKSYKIPQTSRRWPMQDNGTVRAVLLIYTNNLGNFGRSCTQVNCTWKQGILMPAN